MVFSNIPPIKLKTRLRTVIIPADIPNQYLRGFHHPIEEAFCFQSCSIDLPHSPNAYIPSPAPAKPIPAPIIAAPVATAGARAVPVPVFSTHT